jgi:glycosyltransferase involved in cell wall biosynthesis
MSEITLSVIIPITKMAGKLSNLQKTFEECTGNDIEFVIVHDEQDIDTQIELEELISLFPHLKIKHFRETFNSPGLARNYGISKSTGSWFSFSDSDDIPHTANLIKTVKDAEKANAVVGIGRLLKVSEDRDSIVESKYLEGFHRNSLATLVRNPSFTRFVFRWKEFNSIAFPKIRMAEDQVYLARSKFLDHKIYISDLLLYKYYVNVPNQATKNPNSLKELPASLPLIYNLKSLSSSKTKQFVLMLVLKISLTCLVRRIDTKEALRYVFLATIHSPLNSFSLLMSFIRIKIDKR